MRSVLAAIFVAAALAAAAVQDRPWQDASLPVPARVQALMDAMTLEERCRQTWAVHNFRWNEAHEWANASVGSIKLSAFPNNTFEGVLQYRNTIAGVFINGGRLGIPPSFHQETLLSAAPNSTNIPLPVTLGASWDADLVRRVQTLVASELRAVGGDVGYSPEVNMYTDPRFGRLQEGFSSDPTLASELGVAAVSGLQLDGGSGPGTYLPELGVAALAKHFVAYGPAAGGQNVGKTVASPRELVDVYSRPWRAMTARAGLRALMPSHQTVFGVPVHGNAWLGQSLLRAAGASSGGVGIGFDGFSTSDCSDLGALIDWGLAADSEGAAALGMAATVDMDNMCSENADDGAWTYTELLKAVQDGLVPESSVNASARRVLSQKFAAGLFDGNAFVNASGLSRIGTPAHLATAKEAAVKGVVLLRNEKAAADGAPALPLPALGASDAVAVIGPLGDCFPRGRVTTREPCEAQLAHLGKPQHRFGLLTIPTVADEARAAAAAPGGGFAVRVARGASVSDPADGAAIAEAVEAAQGAAAAILVVGDTTESCNEWGDRASLELSGGQAELLYRVATAVPRPARVVVLLVHGRPATLTHNGTDMTPLVDAVVAGWRGGQTGGSALWDVVTGAAAPTGRLPQPWLRSVGQVGGPATSWQLNGKWVANSRGPSEAPGGARPFNPYVFQQSTPLFPLGFGLSYGDFRPSYASVAATCRAVTASSDVVCTATVTLSNAGSDPGVETVQLYAGGFPTPFPVAQDWKRLAAFAKVPLPAAPAGGAASPVTVTMEVRADVLAVTMPAEGAPLGGPQLGARAILKGAYAFSAGSHSLDAAVQASADVPSSVLVA